MDAFTPHHEVWLRLVEVAAAAIQARLDPETSFVFDLVAFDAATRSVRDRGCIPFYDTRSAFRTALGRFCRTPVSTRQPLAPDWLTEWGQANGVVGLIGYYRAGGPVSRLYLSDTATLVLCRFAFE